MKKYLVVFVCAIWFVFGFMTYKALDKMALIEQESIVH